MKRKGRRSRHHGNAGKDAGNGGGEAPDGGYGGDGGDKTRMRVLTLLDGNPGNRTTGEGEPLYFMTVADKNGEIEDIAFTLADTRSLIIDALIALHYFNDDFAIYLIDTYFRAGDPNPRNDWGDRTS